MHTAASILTKATRDVERLAQLQDDSVAARDLAASIRQHVADWERLPSLSVPDLQRLVDAKVILQLATTCSRIAQATPRSLAACAALCMLTAFLKAAAPLREDLKGAPSNGVLLFNISPSQAAACPVLLGMRTQLLQSGLVGSMSGVLTAAAEDLRSQQLQQGHGAVLFGGVLQQCDDDLAGFQHQLLQHCDHLLHAWSDIWQFIHGYWVTPASMVTAHSSGAANSEVQGVQQSQASTAASAPAVVQLAAAVFELLSQRIPQLLAADRKAVLQAVRGSSSAGANPVAEQASQVFGSAHIALTAVATVAGHLIVTDSFAAACLPEFTRLLALRTFIYCQATLLIDRTASAAASSGSSGNSTGSSGSSGSTGGAPASSRQPGASASQADKPRALTLRHLRTAHRELSVCDNGLLQLLGFSSEAAVWVAGRLTETATTHEVGSMAQALLKDFVASTAAAGTVPAQQQLNQQLLLLVPAMLLRWAAQTTGSTAASHADEGQSGVAALLQQLLATINRVRIAEQQADIDSTVNTAVDCMHLWQQCIDNHRTGANSSSAASSTAGASSSVWLQPHLPAEWLQQVFPDIHTIYAAGVMGACLDSWSLLVMFQAQLLNCAADAGSQSDVTAAGAQPEIEVEGSTDSNSSSSTLFETPQPLPAALAAFQGVALQTIASFDGFARSAAQRIAATQRAVTGTVAKAAIYITGLFCREDGRPGPLPALVQAAGPGSREQQALYSCMRSIVKLATASVAAGSEKEQWIPQINTVTVAAVLLLTPLAAEQTCQASAAAGGSSTQSPVPTATVYLPSLVLLGSLSQFWAQQPAAEVAEPSQQQLEDRPSGSMEVKWLVQRVLDWLADSSVMQQLVPAGYGVQQLTAALQGLLAAQAAAGRSMDGEGCSETVTAALRAAQEAAGAALTALATPAFCNNPACQNVSGPTELSLVSGRSCLCGACCVARYCSRACQRAQWAQHKPVCKALAAAAAASAAAAAAGSMG